MLITKIIKMNMMLVEQLYHFFKEKASSTKKMEKTEAESDHKCPFNSYIHESMNSVILTEKSDGLSTRTSPLPPTRISPLSPTEKLPDWRLYF